MLASLRQDPVWVREILHRQWVLFAARLALTSAYLLGGLTKLVNFSAAIAEQEQFGFRPGWFWAAVTILVELGGSLLVLSGYAVWLGAGALGCLTAVASSERTVSGTSRLKIVLHRRIRSSSIWVSLQASC